MANFGNNGPRKPNVPAVPGTAPSGAQFAISEPRCKVCQCSWRANIDSMLSMGMAEVDVHKYWTLALGDDVFSRDSLNRHKNRHMSVMDAAVRNILEKRARQFGEDVENAEGMITTKLGVLDTIIVRGMEALRAGDTVVEAKDVLAAVQLADKMETEWQETAMDEVMAEFKLFTESVKEVVGEEKYDSIFDAFKRRLDLRKGVTLKPLPATVVQPLEIEGQVTEEKTEDA